jgi:hypothetical protein
VSVELQRNVLSEKNFKGFKSMPFPAVRMAELSTPPFFDSLLTKFAAIDARAESIEKAHQSLSTSALHRDDFVIGSYFSNRNENDKRVRFADVLAGLGKMEGHNDKTINWISATGKKPNFKAGDRYSVWVHGTRADTYGSGAIASGVRVGVQFIRGESKHLGTFTVGDPSPKAVVIGGDEDGSSYQGSVKDGFVYFQFTAIRLN